MAPLGGTYNPTDVLMGRPASGSSAYLWRGPSASPPQSTMLRAKELGNTSSGPAASTPAPSVPQGVLGAESIRATGTGPFDSAYRQNLATYAGGQFSRPGGSLNFNPTDPSTFPGNPTGGGNAPVAGMPTSLMDMALSGRGFSWAAPQPAQTAKTPGAVSNIPFWLDQFMRNGRGQRQGSIL